MCGVSKKNKIRNDLQLTPLKDKIKEKSRMLFEIVWACTTKGKKKTPIRHFEGYMFKKLGKGDRLKP